MPTYKFRDENTGEEWEKFMWIAERDEYLKTNPHVSPLISGAPGIISGTGDRTKTDGGFNEVMSRIAEQNPFSPLADTYGKKDHTSVKTREAVKKVRKKIGGAME